MCEKAADDYRGLLKAFGREKDEKELEKLRYSMKAIEEFFLSEYGMLLSFGRGGDIIKYLQKEMLGRVLEE